MDDDELIKLIKAKMEEWGLPKFADCFPAMDILQLVKDAGYSKEED